MSSQADSGRRVPIEPQSVDAPLTASATFLVVTVANAPDAVKTVRSAIAGIGDLTKSVGFRDLGANFTCTVGIGSAVWDSLTGGLRRPAELHPFQAIHGPKHTAVATPGDVLFHIRAERRDLCFEFEKQLLDRLGDAVSVVDETVGFRYFDNRDLLGFIDGTANPTGPAVRDSVVVATEDDNAPFVGGSYVVVQKYLHDMTAWRGLATEAQEAIIGRTKLDNMELPDATGAATQRSHKTLNTVDDSVGGGELAILRDNMPFGAPGSGEFGTYFIGYTRRLWVIEKMLQNMFLGDPPGLHDRLLDYSRAVTGSVFFVPSASLLASLAGDD
ncbi:dyp-type peroxidase family protein [Niveomyces insectorum RCEF 264]|uniref:Dyp-type peroxidase family protein n=1 Tax=Niveomyces insectorum RCEF 264 TaxID=1081102 RepID=A0A167WDE5_9HYPO|nr:dyp-type peroxidase family protein [Niveomyces insectorum RCEF 264]